MSPEDFPENGPAKPTEGSACSRCGICCLSTPCSWGEAFAGGVDGDPCPALVWGEDGRSACGIVVDPETHAPLLVQLVKGMGVTLAFAILGIETRRGDTIATAVRRTLGPGDCDSGPSGPWPDNEVGLNARQWAARGGRRASERLAKDEMAAAGWETKMDENGDLWVRPPEGGPYGRG